MTDDDWNRILDVNLKGTWNACQIVGRVMKEQHYGRIINIASLAAFVASTRWRPIAAARAPWPC